MSSALIDTHCHLDLAEFDDDLAAVLSRAADAGFEKFIIPGITLADMPKIIRMAGYNPAIYYASGIHPNNAAELPEDWDVQVTENAQNERCVAIGEIGLDFYREYCPHDLQIRVFERQLALAEALHLPVIIHCRQAFEALWPILSAWKARNQANMAVLHAFDEDAEKARQAADLGFYFGIGGTYTYTKKNERRQEILRALPLENIVIETDCPYLTPIPHRGERNEPAFARLTAQKIAEIKELPFSQLASQTTENAMRLFPGLAKT